MRRSVLRGLLADTQPSAARRRVTEQIFMDLRDDPTFEKLTDEEIREKISDHLDELGLE